MRFSRLSGSFVRKLVSEAWRMTHRDGSMCRTKATHQSKPSILSSEMKPNKPLYTLLNHPELSCTWKPPTKVNNYWQKRTCRTSTTRSDTLGMFLSHWRTASTPRQLYRWCFNLTTFVEPSFSVVMTLLLLPLGLRHLAVTLRLISARFVWGFGSFA